MIQTLEEVDEFPDSFANFLENNLASKEVETTGKMIVRALRAILNTYPGLYKETMAKVLTLLVGTEESKDLLRKTASELVS